MFWFRLKKLEADECGSLNEWLAIAPKAEPACSVVGAIVNINNIADRQARGLKNNEVLTTGKYRFRFRSTPER